MKLSEINLGQLADDIVAGVQPPSLLQYTPDYVRSLTLHALADAIRMQIKEDK